MISFKSQLEPCASCDSRSLAICADVPADVLDRLAAAAEERFLPPGTTLFAMGQPPHHVYTVRSGTLRLVTQTTDGRRQVLGFPTVGDFFGTSARPAYDYAAEALTACKVCCIRIDRFDALLDSVRALDRNVHRRYDERLCAARGHVVALGRKTAAERIAGFLYVWLRHSAHCGAASVELPMPRGDIADHLGLTLETVSRELSRLRRSGLIRLKRYGRELLVPDPSALLAHSRG